MYILQTVFAVYLTDKISIFFNIIIKLRNDLDNTFVSFCNDILLIFRLINLVYLR